MLNHIVIMGRLARDPELRHTQSGTPVATFRLAVDRDFKDKNTGERATDWIDVVAWRGTGEFVSRYFAKGRMAVVEGRLQMRDWTDKDGNRRTSAEVVADNVYFADSRRDGDGDRGGSYGAAPATVAAAMATAAAMAPGPPSLRLPPPITASQPAATSSPSWLTTTATCPSNAEGHLNIRRSANYGYG